MVVPSGEETSRNVSLIDIDLLRGPPRSRSAPTESPWNRQVGYATPIEMAPRAPPGQRTTLMTCLAPGLPQDEGPDPRVAQEEPSPHQHSEDGGEQEPWVLDAHLGRHGPAQVAREQDRPEERRARHRVEERADEQGQPYPEDGPLGVAELDRPLDRRLEHHDLDAGVEEQERHHERANDAPRPPRDLRGDPGGSARAPARRLSVHPAPRPPPLPLSRPPGGARGKRPCPRPLPVRTSRPPSVSLHRLRAVYGLWLFFTTI